MKIPSGLVTARISRKNRAICSHPFSVISELLRTQQGVHQVGHHQYGQKQHHNGFHGKLLADAIAEADVAGCEGKKSDGQSDKQKVLHEESAPGAPPVGPEAPQIDWIGWAINCS
jgi:hypothetical protein